nr:tetratricopeptide repeat protein [uncultured Acetatifactor sp.]
MAKIKSPLLMADGARVRTMEELREHFDIASVLAYYDNGKLREWLENYYYDAEADEVGKLDPSSADIKEKLCGILGVSCPVEETGNISLADISDKNRRLNKLKKFTSDDEFLRAADYVAFTQEELQGLLDAGAKKIYLCQEEGEFEIPDTEGVTYIGVNKPSASVPEWFGEKGIVFQNVDIGIDELLYSAEKYSEDQDYAEAIKLWSKAAAFGNTEAQRELGRRYHKGEGVTQNYDEACKWYGKAAEQGDAVAKNALVLLYKSGNAEAQKWYKKAAEQGDAATQRKLGDSYYYGDDVKKDYAEACKWYRKAAEQGDGFAQCILGDCYYHGDGVAQDYGEACKWYRKAAEQEEAYTNAQYLLGICYHYGNGVAQDCAEAGKWLKKAAEQGNRDAQDMIDAFYNGGDEEAIQEMSRRKEFEAYVENCKKFLDFIQRMLKSWNAVNGELNSHKGRVQYARFMNNMVNNLNPKSRFGHMIYDNMCNLSAFTQTVFRRYKELEITEICMNGDPDYGATFKVNSDISIAWNEEESFTLEEEFEKNICSVLMEADLSLERMEANLFVDTYDVYQSLGMMLGVRLGTYQCLFKQFFDSLLKALASNDEMLEKVLAISEQYPIAYDKGMENVLIWKYADKDPYIEIKDGNQKYKYETALIHFEAYETTTLLIHFRNMPLSNYTTRYNIVKNEYTEYDFTNFASTTHSLAEVEWGDWVSTDVCELKITKNSDNSLGELIIEITVDEVESAVAVIKSLF